MDLIAVAIRIMICSAKKCVLIWVGFHRMIKKSLTKRYRTNELIHNKKYKLSYDETRIIIMSLIELRNQLIEEGRFTDAVDNIIAKLAA